MNVPEKEYKVLLAQLSAQVASGYLAMHAFPETAEPQSYEVVERAIDIAERILIRCNINNNQLADE